MDAQWRASAAPGIPVRSDALHGFADATKDGHPFDQRSRANGRALTAVLRDLGPEISGDQANVTEWGKAFMPVKNRPSDADMAIVPACSVMFEDDGVAEVTLPDFPIDR